jgi:hypothetical protein
MRSDVQKDIAEYTTTSRASRSYSWLEEEKESSEHINVGSCVRASY